MSGPAPTRTAAPDPVEVAKTRPLPSPSYLAPGAKVTPPPSAGPTLAPGATPTPTAGPDGVVRMLQYSLGINATTMLGQGGTPIKRLLPAPADVSLLRPASVSIGTDGYFVADTGNNQIHKLTPHFENEVLIYFEALTLGTGTAGSTDGVAETCSFRGPTGIAVDGQNTVYVAEPENNLIRRCKLEQVGGGTSVYVTKVYAGSTEAGFFNDVGKAARFSQPTALTYDMGGNLYVADTGNHRIRKITAAQVVTTFAGSGERGYADGVGLSSQFNAPKGVAVDATGTVYVSDSGNHRIRKISPTGVVSTLAGTGVAGDGDGAGTVARFNDPRGLTIDGDGNLYVADYGNRRIRKVTPTGSVSTLAGNGESGGKDSAGRLATFSAPEGLVFDAAGNFLVADSGNHNIRKLILEPVVTTIAGPKTSGAAPSTVSDGTGESACFNNPWAITSDPAGVLYVAELSSSVIRKLTLSNPLTGDYEARTFAGSSERGFADGAGTAAKFFNPRGIALDAKGNVFVADTGNHRIRKITPDGTVSTVAGTGTPGFADGKVATAQFNAPRGIAVGSDGTLYVADTENHRLRRIGTDGQVVTLAGDGTPGSDNGPSTRARFSFPSALCLDARGDIYVADYGNHRIRKVAYAASQGGNTYVVSHFAGSGAPGYSDAGGTSAGFNNPTGITIDRDGNLYVADYGNSAIRKIKPDGSVSTPAGVGADAHVSSGYVDGAGTAARFAAPTGVAADASGYIYVTDMVNNRVRQIQ